MTEGYTYKVSTTMDVNPSRIDPRVYGHHKSVVPPHTNHAAYFRQWAFEDRDGFEKFKVDYAKEIIS